MGVHLTSGAGSGSVGTTAPDQVTNYLDDLTRSADQASRNIESTIGEIKTAVGAGFTPKEKAINWLSPYEPQPYEGVTQDEPLFDIDGVPDIPGANSSATKPDAILCQGITGILSGKYTGINDPGAYSGYNPGASYNFGSAPTQTDADDPTDFSGGTGHSSMNPNIDLQPLTQITDPQITPLKLPDIPEFDSLVTFEATAPSFDLALPTGTFEFNETLYSSDVLTQTDALVQTMIAGGVGIPDAIWDAIFAKAEDREYNASLLAENEAVNMFSERGFSLPQGTLVALVQQAKQEANNKTATLSREIAIQYAQEEVKNLQFAVQQGIALEQLRGSWHEQRMQRTLDAAKFLFESYFRTMEAEIAIENAKLELYNIQSQVYKTRLESEAIKYEKYRLELQKQELVSEENKTQIQVHAAKMSELDAVIKKFNAEVGFRQTEVQEVQSRISLYSERIKEYAAEIQEIDTKVQVYKTKAEVEGIKAGAYETSVKAYMAETQAYNNRIDAAAKQIDAEVGIQDLKVKKYAEEVKAWEAELRARVDTYEANIRGFEAEIEKFKQDIQQEQFKNQYKLDEQKYNLEGLRIQHETEMHNAARKAELAAESTRLAVEANKAIADIEAGLTGSMYSALNISAGMSQSVRGDVSVSSRRSFSGGSL